MKQEQIFSKDFLNLDYKAVTKELNEKGYFSFDNALYEYPELYNKNINKIIKL